MPPLTQHMQSAATKEKRSDNVEPPSITTAKIQEVTLIAKAMKRNGVNTRTTQDTLLDKCNIKLMCIAF